MTEPAPALPFVVGTAGHVDHGKTALVHALTGIDTDRLAVEKARGITTELGFAHLTLPDGSRVAVVDVPGHERFVRSMVAGATGLDLVVMVIAADEGVMPQTREHLDVCELLGVRRGLIAISKRDLVDDDWLALLDEELDRFTAGTFLAGAPRLPVSARTGAGLDALVAAIAAALHALPPRPDGGLLRVPIDRVFTLRGFGTVVTGTIAGGAIAVGDEVTLHPRGLASKVRGLQVHGAAATRARAGQRVAINLPGLATDQLARGDVVAHAGALAPSHLLDVRVRHVAAATAALPLRSKVLVHHGTTQVLATLVLAGPAPLAPGAEGFAQLRLDRATPLAALPGDRFLLRGFAPLADHGTTLGGGAIVRVHAAKLRAGGADLVARFAAARAAERVALELKAAAAALPTAAVLAQRTGLAAAELAALVDELVGRGEVLRAGDELLHVETAAALEKKVREVLAAAAAETPPRLEVPREELRQRLPAALPVRGFERVLHELVERGAVEVSADVVRRAAAPRPTMNAADAALLARFRTWGLEPPRPKEIAAATGSAEALVKPSLDRLLAARLIVKVKPDYYADAAAIAALQGKLLAYLDAHREITPQAWKELTGVTRKFSIPLAEYFDAEKVTLRIGDLRRRR